MKYSKYNILFNSQKYGFLLYNSESNSFAELDQDLYDKLLKIKNKELSVDALDVLLLGELKNAKILVEDESIFNAQRKLMYYLGNFNTSKLGLAIAPTTFCNFNCSYCYEENRKPIFMTDETENDLLRFIKKYNKIEKLDITWYGGEPLANFKSIKSILKKISIDEKIVIGNHTLITNGYLLDKEKSEFFVNYHLDNVQITIDGSKESHNKRRVLQNGGATYDTIIKNIDAFVKLNEKTQISIRVNIDIENSADYIKINKTLIDKWQKNNIVVYPAFVRDYSDSCSNNCQVLQHEDKVKFLFDLYKKHDIDIDFYPELVIGGCGATSLNYYVVGPEGELYKCWNDIGIEEKIIGYLNNNTIPNKDILSKYLVGPSIFDDKKCEKCEIFPICDGGCQWVRMKNTNEGKSFDLCSTRKYYITQFLELHYEMKLKKTKQFNN